MIVLISIYDFLINSFIFVDLLLPTNSVWVLTIWKTKRKKYKHYATQKKIYNQQLNIKLTSVLIFKYSTIKNNNQNQLYVSFVYLRMTNCVFRFSNRKKKSLFIFLLNWNCSMQTGWTWDCQCNLQSKWSCYCVTISLFFFLCQT